MTRSDFVNNVTTWDDLMSFCYDNDCDINSDIVDDDGKDEYLNEILSDICANSCGWEDLKQTLQDIPTDYYWYMLNGGADILGLEDGDYDFDCRKDNVLEWADENGRIWDDEETEDGDECEASSDDDDDDWQVDENFSIDSLLADCSSEMQVIQHSQSEKDAQDEQDFDALLFPA